VSVALAPPASAVHCPVCGKDNSAVAQFCIHCHAILIRRCPTCWHQQREGNVCEHCGANFALYWATALERSLKKEDRPHWTGWAAAADDFVRILLLPFTRLASLASLVRALVARLIAGRLPGR